MRKIKALLAVILALQLVGSALSFAETETVEEVEETATPSEQQIQGTKCFRKGKTRILQKK